MPYIYRNPCLWGLFDQLVLEHSLDLPGIGWVTAVDGRPGDDGARYPSTGVKNRAAAEATAQGVTQMPGSPGGGRTPLIANKGLFRNIQLVAQVGLRT